jgi:hypothetical protein
MSADAARQRRGPAYPAVAVARSPSGPVIATAMPGTSRPVTSRSRSFISGNALRPVVMTVPNRQGCLTVPVADPNGVKWLTRKEASVTRAASGNGSRAPMKRAPAGSAARRSRARRLGHDRRRHEDRAGVPEFRGVACHRAEPWQQAEHAGRQRHQQHPVDDPAPGPPPGFLRWRATGRCSRTGARALACCHVPRAALGVHAQATEGRAARSSPLARSRAWFVCLPVEWAVMACLPQRAGVDGLALWPGQLTVRPAKALWRGGMR